MQRSLRIWICLFTLLLAACGSAGTRSVGDAAHVDLEASIESDGWAIRLTEVPEKHLILGKGNITYQAENDNTFLIVFLDVANTSSTLKVMARDLLLVRDGSGTEYKATKSALQVAYLEQDGSKDGYTVVLDSPLQPGKNRQGVVTFEVLDAASDLVLTFKGTDLALPLGF